MTRNKRRPGEGVVPMKIAAFDLWQEMHPTKPSAGLVSNRQTWQRPEPGWVKGNVDASFHAETRAAASGLVLRDQEGKACGGKAIWYDCCLNPLVAEVKSVEGPHKPKFRDCPASATDGGSEPEL